MKTLKANVARVHGQHKTLFDSALVATGFLIFLLTLPNTAINITAGLDSSYAMAFNYFFVVGAQIGRDILFTYGPLGFLEWPQPQGNNLLYANIIYTVVHLIFVASLLWLGLKGRGPLEQIIVLVLILFFSYLLPAFMYLKLVFMVGILLLLHFETRHAWLLLLAISLVVLAMLIRSTYGILGVVILLPYLVYLAFAENRVKVAISALIGLGVMLVAVWFLIYDNLNGLLPYLIGILEFSSGNSSAMTINPPNNWLILVGFTAIVCYLPYSVRQKKGLVFYWVFGLSILIYLKYALSREGPSLNYAFVYLLVIFFIFTLYVRPLRTIHYLMITAALGLFGINMKYYGGGADPLQYVSAQVKSNFVGRSTWKVIGTLINYREHGALLLRISEDRLRPHKFSSETRSVIGRDAVDAYPYEISYVAANGFNYKPRPVIQSYIAYTPYLDQKNAQFFQSAQAPVYLLWEAPHGDIQNSSIDGRYVLNDEPMTIFEILGRYSPAFKDGNVVVLKHTGFQKFQSPRSAGMSMARWNEWVTVPANNCEILRGRLGVSRTLLGKLKRFAYKEEEFYIEYKLADESIRKHRLVVDNAISGVWVTPYVKNILKWTSSPVTEVKVLHSKSDFLNAEVRWDWVCVNKRSAFE